MAEVVCDVVILTRCENLPPGYCLVEPPISIEQTKEKRFLAYKTQEAGPKVFAVTDISVRKDISLVPPGYKTLNYTTPDNVESFSDRIILVKKDGWSAVLEGIPQAVTDIIILHTSQRDDMPCGYKMIHEINGMSICFKRNNLKYGNEFDEDGYEEEDDDVFGDDLAYSDDEDFYEIPSSSNASVKSPTQDSEEVDGSTTRGSKSKKQNKKMVIRSIPVHSSERNNDAIYPEESQSIKLKPLYSNLRFSSDIDVSGYPVDQFLTPPPSSMICAKCNQVLMSPYLLSCCSSHVCEGCLLSVQRSADTRCPSCESEDYDFELSSQVKEEADLLLLRCLNSKRGCRWQGQLGEIDIHLFISCPYSEITCENDCGKQFLRCDAAKHRCDVPSTSVSPFFPSNSQQKQQRKLHNTFSRSASCVEELSYRIIEIQRKQEEEMSVVKKELKKFHSVKDNGMSENSYVKLGFEVRALKRQLAESFQRETALERKLKEQAEDIRILKETHNMFRLQFDNLIDQLQMKSFQGGPALPMSPIASPTSLKQPPCEFVIDNFNHYLKTPDSEWYSEPFTSDVRGYKFCLQVVPHGMMSSAGSDVSICVKLMRGDYDDHLKWPFQGRITIQILNWLCDQRHATRIIDFNVDARRYGACGRVPSGSTGDRAAKGWGIVPFLPHGYLPYSKERNTEFMRNNCLCIRVASISLP